MIQPAPTPHPTTICVDFDGTIVEHCYPFIGQPVPGAIVTLQWLSQQDNVRLILYTMRSLTTEKQAAEFCCANGIKLWGVNHNHEQGSWSQSPKVYANHYIDDAAIGCPLVKPNNRRPYVDWLQVVNLLHTQAGLRLPGPLRAVVEAEVHRAWAAIYKEKQAIGAPFGGE